MRRQRQKKGGNYESVVTKKTLVYFILIIVAFLGLAGRLIYIYKVSGDKYEKKVLSQQEYTNKTIPYRRGDILDRNGTVLATSTDVYNVILDCKVMNTKAEYKKETIKALTTCFTDITQEEVEKYLTDSPKSQYIKLREDLSYEAIQKFVKMQDDVDTGTNIKGIWFEKEYVRSYPFNTVASAVLGFTSAGNVGNWGIEEEYNEELNGENGREYGYLNEDTAYEVTVEDATDGDQVMSTIDVNIQSIVEKHIAAFNAKYKDNVRDGEGSKNVAVVIMNPNNGEIIAMADSSGYNLNDPYNLSSYYTQAEIDAMDEKTSLEALSSIWRNFCISDTYEPGSTVKPFTVATGLESGILTGNETYVCDGGEEIGGYKIKCSNAAGHGTITLEQALMLSCNDAMMQIASKLGPDLFCKYQEIFNFGIKTNIDLPGEAKTTNLIYKAEDMKSTDLATNSFGQNFNVTMVQMVSAFSSLVNGGNYYRPHVVKSILDSEGNIVEDSDATLLKQTVSAETSDLIKEYLYQTVEAGTGTVAQVEGYAVGGKTGTAEKINRDKENYLLSFIGCVPADNPELVIYTIVDEPNVEVQASSTYAQQLTKDILTEILPIMNIEKVDSVSGDAAKANAADSATDSNALILDGVSLQQDEDTGATSGDAQEQ